MGSTCSGPVAYLQKQGWPEMGMPASVLIFCSCWVNDLNKRAQIKNKNTKQVVVTSESKTVVKTDYTTAIV